MANQLATLQAWPMIWTQGYCEQKQVHAGARAELEPCTAALPVQCANHSALLSP